MIQEIDGFVWSGDKMSWVDADGKSVSRQKDRELTQRFADLTQRQMMERLDIARAAFECMGDIRERKAAHQWLREIYGL